MSDSTRIDLLRQGTAAGRARLRAACDDDPLTDTRRAAMSRIKAFDGGAGGFALALHAGVADRGRDADAPAGQMASS